MLTPVMLHTFNPNKNIVNCSFWNAFSSPNTETVISLNRGDIKSQDVCRVSYEQ